MPGVPPREQHCNRDHCEPLWRAQLRVGRPALRARAPLPNRAPGSTDALDRLGLRQGDLSHCFPCFRLVRAALEPPPCPQSRTSDHRWDEGRRDLRQPLRASCHPSADFTRSGPATHRATRVERNRLVSASLDQRPPPTLRAGSPRRRDTGSRPRTAGPRRAIYSRERPRTRCCVSENSWVWGFRWLRSTAPAVSRTASRKTLRPLVMSLS
jgi:hypothetical protein